MPWNSQGPRRAVARGLLVVGLVGRSSFLWGKIFETVMLSLLVHLSVDDGLRRILSCSG